MVQHLYFQEYIQRKRKCLYPHAHCSIIYDNPRHRQPKWPLMDEWIKKMWFLYTMENYSVIKKGNSAICNNMDRLWGYYAKRNKSDRQKQILDDLQWSLKNRIRFITATREEAEGWVNLGKKVKRYKLPVLR